MTHLEDSWGVTCSMTTVPEIIGPVFAKTSPKRSFSMTKNERFGLVFLKTGSINSGTDKGKGYKELIPWDQCLGVKPHGPPLQGKFTKN